MTLSNIHATTVAVGDRGILITGPSGAGKTALALALIGHATAAGRFGRLVADDQTLLSLAGGRLIARAPDTIAGLVEVRGLGPRPIPATPNTVIDLAVDLLPPARALRFQEAQSFTFGGASIPMLALVARNTLQSVAVVAAWLGWPPFSATPPLL